MDGWIGWSCCNRFVSEQRGCLSVPAQQQSFLGCSVCHLHPNTADSSSPVIICSDRKWVAEHLVSCIWLMLDNMSPSSHLILIFFFFLFLFLHNCNMSCWLWVNDLVLFESIPLFFSKWTHAFILKPRTHWSSRPHWAAGGHWKLHSWSEKLSDRLKLESEWRYIQSWI